MFRGTCNYYEQISDTIALQLRMFKTCLLLYKTVESIMLGLVQFIMQQNKATHIPCIYYMYTNCKSAIMIKIANIHILKY